MTVNMLLCHPLFGLVVSDLQIKIVRLSRIEANKSAQEQIIVELKRLVTSLQRVSPTKILFGL